MSGLLGKYDVEIDLNADRIPEPAKRWINKAIVVKRYRSIDTGEIMRVGDLIVGSIAHPSKEVAEQRISEYAKDQDHALYRKFIEYLGAFPE